MRRRRELMSVRLSASSATEERLARPCKGARLQRFHFFGPFGPNCSMVRATFSSTVPLARLTFSRWTTIIFRKALMSLPSGLFRQTTAYTTLPSTTLTAPRGKQRPRRTHTGGWPCVAVACLSGPGRLVVAAEVAAFDRTSPPPLGAPRLQICSSSSRMTASIALAHRSSRVSPRKSCMGEAVDSIGSYLRGAEANRGGPWRSRHRCTTRLP